MDFPTEIAIMILSVALLITNVCWIEYNKMLNKKIENLDAYFSREKIRNMEAVIEELAKCHKRELSTSYPMGGLYCFSHEQEMCYTQRIKDVTLKELAQYVLDGKPIIREKMVKKEYKPQCGKK